MPFSYVAAFLGGTIALFSPCSLMVIPLFTAGLHRNSGRAVNVIVLFVTGLIVSLLPVVIGARVLQLVFSEYREIITTFFGIVFVVLGLIQLLGVQFSTGNLRFNVPIYRRVTETGFAFSLGLVAGLSSVACIGPILGAIVSFGINSNSFAQIMLLIGAYIAGLMTPLLIIANISLHRMPVHVSRQVQRTVYTFRGKPVSFFGIGIGLLYLMIAYVFLIHQGSVALTSFVKQSGILDASFNLQDSLFEW
jgi:cytochrome c biogenesis protein CcdA